MEPLRDAALLGRCLPRHRRVAAHSATLGREARFRNAARHHTGDGRTGHHFLVKGPFWTGARWITAKGIVEDSGAASVYAVRNARQRRWSETGNGQVGDGQSSSVAAASACRLRDPAASPSMDFSRRLVLSALARRTSCRLLRLQSQRVSRQPRDRGGYDDRAPHPGRPGGSRLRRRRWGSRRILGVRRCFACDAKLGSSPPEATCR